MKKLTLLLFVFAIVSCSGDDDNGNSGTDPDGYGSLDYKNEMRNFVIGISQKAKAANSNFIIIPQNGIELVTINGEDDGMPATAYLGAIDGNGQEDLFYGYDNDNQATHAEDTGYLKKLLDISKNAGKTILVTDYCSSQDKISSSFQVNQASGYISYAATERDLNVIPQYGIYNENAGNITSLSHAKNFLYLINPDKFASKADFINAVTATNYDAVIMDLYVENEVFTAAEINQIRQKANGGKRLVICYMSIGEAENYRYYWNSSWDNSNPGFLEAENPDWPGNYKVQYWNENWQDIIYKNPDSYLSKIQGAGFDGVYLDIIDAFEYFEN